MVRSVRRSATATPKKIRQFRREVYAYYRRNKRSLPWRTTRDPYGILVSEVMLQQTQVSRVVRKYREFLRAFPDVTILARAQLADILKLWQGLGYNRRALLLKNAAYQIVKDFHGAVPSDVESLQKLPGIGYATACAIRAFAFNKPAVFIETNIRSVFIHHFFSSKENVQDAQIVPLVVLALDQKNPRRWYSALMDYGVFLKAAVPNPGRKSSHYYRQSRFHGSRRQLRGRIIKMVIEGGRIHTDSLSDRLEEKSIRVGECLVQLSREGLIRMEDGLIYAGS
jgi:A/G-specific adenine glycosylase